jgi:hypothetical protein
MMAQSMTLDNWIQFIDDSRTYGRKMERRGMIRSIFADLIEANFAGADLTQLLLWTEVLLK